MFLKPRVRTPRQASAGTRGAPLWRRTSARRPAPGTDKGAPKKSGRRRWLRRLVVWGGSAAIWTLVAAAGLIAWYAYDLPEVGGIAQIARQPSVTLMSADGTLIVSYGEVHGARVSVAALPPHLPLAVLAVEDRRFYQHA
ncbi:MAG: hypothetical protein V3U23_01545, partial [Kiloniellales bacterium]